MGNKEETVKYMMCSLQVRIQWTDLMQNILELIIINNHNSIKVSKLTQASFLFCICDISLLAYKTALVQFLVLIKMRDYIRIVEYKYILIRLCNHNSEHGFSSIISSHRQPFAIL